MSLSSVANGLVFELAVLRILQEKNIKCVYTGNLFTITITKNNCADITCHVNVKCLEIESFAIIFI